MKATFIKIPGAMTEKGDSKGMNTAIAAMPGFNHDEWSLRFWFRHPIFLILMMAVCMGMSPSSAFAAPSSSPAAAGNVTLAWNPSISTNVAGYDIYYGTTSGVYNSMNYVAGSTNVTITNLVEGTTYYFTAAAVNTQGAESQFSNEIEYTVPNPYAAVLTVVTPPSRGQFALTINGMTGSIYVVQVSTNLVSWTSVETNIAPFTFVDVNADRFSQRFYRSFYLP